MVRLRFAPSPTGYLHVGAARTALFNWLYARRQNGRFILRIEDTDMARSSEEMTKGIMEGLRWLGMDWDEGPIFQSKRLEIYRRKAEELVRRKLAYYCYCRSEETGSGPAQAERDRSAWSSGHCCSELSPGDLDRHKNEGRTPAVRFFVPLGEIRYTDLIHGPISVSSETVEDFVLLRGDGYPTYHLSVVVDDIDLGITHIVRGDDHISNTPKQILLYRAFGARPPLFAHLALILGPDRRKLSKRHGVTSILQFRDEGYLPLAMVNFLAQLGWSPGEDSPFFTVEELIRRFSLKKASKGSPLFDTEKLDWINGQVITHMSSAELAPLIREELERAGLWRSSLDSEERDWFLRLIELFKGRNRTVLDFGTRLRPFLSDEFPFDPAGVEKHLRHPGLAEALGRLRSDFESLPRFEAVEIEAALRRRAEAEGFKAALLIHSLRMLVLGVPVSPGLFEVLELAGLEKTVERMGRLSRVVTTAPSGSG